MKKYLKFSSQAWIHSKTTDGASVVNLELLIAVTAEILMQNW